MLLPSDYDSDAAGVVLVNGNPRSAVTDAALGGGYHVSSDRNLTESEEAVFVGDGTGHNTSAMMCAEQPHMGARDRLATAVHDDSADGAGGVTVAADGLHRVGQGGNQQSKRGKAEPDANSVTCHDELLLKYPSAERTRTAAVNPATTHSSSIQHLPD